MVLFTFASLNFDDARNSVRRLLTQSSPQNTSQHHQYRRNHWLSSITGPCKNPMAAGDILEPGNSVSYTICLLTTQPQD